jgi:hypothetical protein
MSTHTVPSDTPEPQDAARVEDVPLFDGYEPPALASRDESLSAGQRLTARQLENVRAGVHPLTRGRLHPEASREASRDDPKGQPFTCGTCPLRRSWGAHGYPKCELSTPGRGFLYLTHGPATDVRAWWPACESYAGQPEAEG